jgi:signal transduction histidine kinase/AraC-like DNA-binding protein/ligand-binding sensor domain-containing protein
MCNKRYLLITIIILLVSPMPGKCSSPYTPRLADPLLEPWRWQQFLEFNGKGCRCVTEDRNGSLWFGINGGVLRYDGLSLEYFPFDGEFSQNSVTAILAASDGTIYAGTPRGICRLLYGKWKYISHNLGYADSLDSPHNQLPIIETTDRSIWIGTHAGALRIRNGEISLYRKEQVYPNLQDKYSEHVEKEIKTLPPFDVFSIMEQNERTLWIGLRNGELFRCSFFNNNMITNPEWMQIEKKHGFQMARFPQIKKTQNNAIIVINGETDKGFNIYEKAKWKQVELNSIFPGVGDIHADILEFEDGTLWISGVGRIFQLKNNKWKIYEIPKLPLPADRLKLFQASDNSIWIIGICNEVWRIDCSNNRWTTFDGLNFQCEGWLGEKWFITHDFKVVKCDSTMKNWIRYDGLDGMMDAPTRIIITKKGVVWAAGSHQQIAATAFLTGERWRLHMHPTLSWSFDWRAAFEAKDGSLWFGVCPDFIVEKGQRGGLVRYPCPDQIGNSTEEREYHYFSPSFYINGIYGIGQGADDRVWVGQMGLFTFSDFNKPWNEITEPAGVNKQFIDCIASSPEGDIWVGCRTNGVFRLSRSTHAWTMYNTENGLSGNTIINIFAQSDSNVWVITNHNICHFDGQSWTKNVFPELYKFTTAGGALRIARDGTLWINQLHRSWHRLPINKINLPDDPFQSFRTFRYRPDKGHPETAITFAEEEISQPGNFIVSWEGRDPWKLTTDDRLEFSYRIDQQPWSYFSSEKGKLFPALSDGVHIFEVRARDRDFNVDPAPAKMKFRVLPPIWKQFWFVGLILSFFLTISVFIVYIIHRDKLIRELSETKVRLFANIAHELRTPLTLIMGPLRKILESTDVGEKWQNQLFMMDRNAKRLMRLVNQALDFQKIEANQLIFEPVKGDIIQFIYETAHSFVPLADEKKINYDIKIDISDLEMWYDPDKVEKILFNILSNAIKFTPPKGRVSLVVTLSTMAEECEIKNEMFQQIKYKDWLEIDIQDTGIGIPTDKLHRVFERYYQVNSPAAAHLGGTGIGLSLTKELIGLHLGEFKLTSSEGRGTLFKVKLPVIFNYQADATPLNDTHPDVVPVFHSSKQDHNLLDDDVINKNAAKVLIVEDNQDMRAFIRDEFKAEFMMYEAKDGVEGFKKAVKYTPDIIISDVMMPYMDGLQFCSQIKSDERTSHIPVILLTARSSVSDKIKGLEAKADDYVAKPFHSQELKLRVQNLIESRQKLRERFSKEFHVEPAEITITPVDEKFLAKAIAIVEENIDNPDLDTELLSRKIGMSRASLYPKLKALTNSSVQEFIFTIRLKRAAHLLKSSGMNVVEVAYEVGFKDSSHFSKLFKKRFGVSPSNFIKENHHNQMP